ncbi:PREDICTED: subtilisin-like protease SBT5.4 [Lupinus angustifolius]|uniref:subtilisin-like protease SBT5.4 n=1 Tax=Lupinus angustifolius TaxID=3871 RepID=UPI00092F5680|nr:PREDICTED: subtilisin-like protease SBT5.4 [Lupinus angustifolius]
MSSSIYHVLLSLLCFMLQQSSLAIKQSYVVYLGSHSFGQNAESVANSHYDLLGPYVGGIEKAKEAIFYSYNRHVNGFAAILDEDEAAKIAEHSSVVSIFVNKKRELHTTHSWQFLELERNGAIPSSSIWRKTMGENIIVGNIDSGVWPESKSFSDEGIGPVPTKWHGTCQTDTKNLDKFQCNRKLIGARYFSQGYEASDEYKEVNNTTDLHLNTARDYESHGTHTLSTAGGNFVPGASVFGNGNGTASGGAPKSHVATYKVCWGPDTSCYDADILAAFDAAIGDGVDVLSISLGGGDGDPDYFQSGISIGSFHAVSKGIIVVAAAGNYGPDLKTVRNVEPWTLTVGATTIDREFNNYITLGDGQVFKGPSLSESGLPSNELYPLINSLDAIAKNATAQDACRIQCQYGSLDPKKAHGKILFCIANHGEYTIDQGVEAVRVGAAGIILADYDFSWTSILLEPHVLPASHVNYTDGNNILTYIKHTKSPVATISRVKTELGIKPSPLIATFSSRGPNYMEPAILKPDITAPGNDIIAAYSEAAPPLSGTLDQRRTPFMILSGTSMACPHVSGIAALLKVVHPDWSPAAIKSAIMTTAIVEDNTGGPILDSSLKKATPFDYGAGQIRPNNAVNPGLVYDLDTTDYLNFLCGRGYNSSTIKLFYKEPYTCPESFNLADFNYPSITIINLDSEHPRSVTRTLTNVGPPSTYKVLINEHRQVETLVEPNILIFKEKGEKKKFKVTFKLRPPLKEDQSHYFFGRLDWTNGKHHVRSPFVVQNPNA